MCHEKEARRKQGILRLCISASSLNKGHSGLSEIHIYAILPISMSQYPVSK